MERATKLGSLNNIKRLGFYPKTVIDVGAQVGTHCLYEVFPDSHHVLIEPVEENEGALKQICKNMKKEEYIIAAATSQDCNVDLSVSPNTKYSHAYHSNNQNGWTVRQVRGITVDSLCEDKKLQAPYLLKIDVDGTEIDVLKGPRQRHEGESAEDYVEYLESYTAQFKNHHGILLHKTPAKK